MLRVGLTGGIGSGKSTVASMFAELGAPIIDADEIAHRLTEPHSPTLAKIVSHFGRDIVDDKGSLDRKQLRDVVFNDPQQRHVLEEILHPLIRERMLEAIKQSSGPYCILVIPLLAESNRTDFVDRVIVVDIDPVLQLQRARDRDDASEAEIDAIMHSQTSREARLSIADDVIHNDSDFEHLREQVVKLHYAFTSGFRGQAAG